MDQQVYLPANQLLADYHTKPVAYLHAQIMSVYTNNLSLVHGPSAFITFLACHHRQTYSILDASHSFLPYKMRNFVYVHYTSLACLNSNQLRSCQLPTART
jgi:hypothetical protein